MESVSGRTMTDPNWPRPSLVDEVPAPISSRGAACGLSVRLTKDGVGSLHDVTQEHFDRWLIHRLESETSAQRTMAEVAVLNDLARCSGLFTTDRYPCGFEP